MALTCCFARSPLFRPPYTAVNIRVSSKSNANDPKLHEAQFKKRCLRCNTLYFDHHNSPSACSFHGHTTGEKGLFSLAPPHQGIDGEWTDGSGVIINGMIRVIGQILEVPTGRKDGAVVPSTMKTPHLAVVVGMFPMMMASLCISPSHPFSHI